MWREHKGHGKASCTAVSHQRNVFRMKMKFYNAPTTADLRDKDIVFSLAFSHKIFLQTFCEFLAILNEKVEGTLYFYSTSGLVLNTLLA